MSFFHLPLRGRQVKRISALRATEKSSVNLPLLRSSAPAEDGQTSRVICSYNDKVSFCLPPSSALWNAEPIPPGSAEGKKLSLRSLRLCGEYVSQLLINIPVSESQKDQP